MGRIDWFVILHAQLCILYAHVFYIWPEELRVSFCSERWLVEITGKCCWGFSSLRIFFPETNYTRPAGATTERLVDSNHHHVIFCLFRIYLSFIDSSVCLEAQIAPCGRHMELKFPAVILFVVSQGVPCCTSQMSWCPPVWHHQQLHLSYRLPCECGNLDDGAQWYFSL
jgi:hypothetical protein